MWVDGVWWVDSGRWWVVGVVVGGGWWVVRVGDGAWVLGGGGWWGVGCGWWWVGGGQGVVCGGWWVHVAGEDTKQCMWHQCAINLKYGMNLLSSLKADAECCKAIWPETRAHHRVESVSTDTGEQTLQNSNLPTEPALHCASVLQPRE